MPLLIDTDSRTDTLVRAINDVLIDKGPSGLSLRRIAEYSGVSTSSMLHHLGSREHLLRVAAGRTAERRLAHLRVESSLDGALAFVPRNGDEVLDARAWLAWQELWRSESGLERTLAVARQGELALLAGVFDYQLVRSQLQAIAALVDGLLVAICSPREPMRLDEARQILGSRCHTWPTTSVSPSPPLSRRTA